MGLGSRIGGSSSFALCLLASILLNIIFVTNLYEAGKWNHQLSWTERASAEAEAAASISCSGHGRAYLDGQLVDGLPACECNRCYGGPDCSVFLPSCAADVDSGDPLFLEPFWMQNAATSTMVVAGWHRMSYSFSDHTYISQELEKLIRKVHAIAKNAVTEGKYIVFGAGSTQLLNAAVFALSENTTSCTEVVAATPFYPLYKSQTSYFRSINFEFQGDARLVGNTSDATENIIEFVTSPNNPDGFLNKAVLKGPFVRTIHDHAYYWPHFTAIPAPANEDLMIFTISKLTGHAGSRFGWAIIKDEDVYQRMSEYISVSEMGISRDTQLRAFTLLKAILKGDGTDIFNFASGKMKDRWRRLSQVIESSTRFSLQQIGPQYCTFFGKVRGPSPAYAWLKCEREEDTNCNAVLGAANIIGRDGSIFSVESRYVRLSLLKSQDDFDLLLQRISKLVSEENAAEII